MPLVGILVAASVAFAPPASRVAVKASVPRAPAPLALGGFEMPKLPELPNPFGGGNDFQLFPSDVQFTDRDGDVVVLRPVQAGKVDFYVNKSLKLQGATLQKSADGQMLEITGKIQTPFAFLGALGFKLEDIVTEGTVPQDPEDLDKAMALVA